MSLTAAGPELGPSSHDADRLLAGYRAARAQETLFDLRGGDASPRAFGTTGYDEFVDTAGQVRPDWSELADLLAGRWYANIHTAAHPGGELRGQMTQR